MNTGSIGAWRIVPGLQGIGIASFVITCLMNIYYIVVIAWAFNYLILSFTSELPWSTCGNDWNTPRCLSPQNNTCTLVNITNGSVCANLSVADGKTVDAVVEFWERRILHISDGVDNPGCLVWQLVLSLFVVWLLVYLCVWRGISWMGKVAYFTALFPYVMLLCLLIRGVTLEGAAEGIRFYLRPDFSMLANAQVWIDGGTQIFFSYAIAIGAMISLGSYNKFDNNFYKDCFIIASVNSGTSIFGGFAVFSVLGFMAAQQNTTVAEVAESGPGLVFIAYPKAVTEMPLPPLWSIMFFFMILLIGLNSQFVGVEAILTPINDLFPKHLYKTRNRMIVGALYCGISFLIGLCMVTEGGMYVFQIFDYYSCSGFVLLWVLFFESIAVGWIFGAERFYDAIELMLGKRISLWFKLCWKILTPVVTMGILLFITIRFIPLTYNKTYVYPTSFQVFGLCLALVSMVCIPIVFVWKMVKAPGTLRQKLRHVTTPILKPNQIVSSWREAGYKWRMHQLPKST